MPKLEREKYLLTLNDTQRLALLFTLSNHLKRGDFISYEGFKQILMSYHPKEKRG